MPMAWSFTWVHRNPKGFNDLRTGDVGRCMEVSGGLRAVVEAIPALHYPVDLTSGRSGHRAAHTHTHAHREPRQPWLNSLHRPSSGRLAAADLCRDCGPRHASLSGARDGSGSCPTGKAHQDPQKLKPATKRRATTFPAEPATEQGLSVSYAKMQCIACMCNAPYPVPS